MKLPFNPESARELKCLSCERAVVCALIRYPEMCVGLTSGSRGVSAADFYFDIQRMLFQCVVSQTPSDTKGFHHNLANLYTAIGDTPEIVRTYGKRVAAHELAECYLHFHWDRDVPQWWEPEYDSLPLRAALGLGAGRKMRYLSARRHAIYKASEDALAAINGLPPHDYYDE